MQKVSLSTTARFHLGSSRTCLLLAFALALVLPAACSRQKVRQYSEQAQPGRVAPEASSPVSATEPLGELKWVLPAGWSMNPSTGMRLATFQTANGLECSMIPLRGEAGGLVANSRRWLDQLNVTSDPKELESFCGGLPEFRSCAGIRYRVADLTPFTGASSESIIVALSSFSDVTLFIKLKGEKSKVLSDRAGLVALCASLSH